jgi:hypothetical protein
MEVKMIDKKRWLMAIGKKCNEEKKKEEEKKKKDKPKISAYDLTDEQVAGSIGHEVSDFNDDGSDLDELRDIMEGNV